MVRGTDWDLWIGLGEYCHLNNVKPSRSVNKGYLSTYLVFFVLFCFVLVSLQFFGNFQCTSLTFP